MMYAEEYLKIKEVQEPTLVETTHESEVTDIKDATFDLEKDSKREV